MPDSHLGVAHDDERGRCNRPRAAIAKCSVLDCVRGGETIECVKREKVRGGGWIEWKKGVPW